MLTDQSMDPYSTESDDERRQRVMQALLAQSRSGQGGAVSTLDQTLKTLAQDQMQQQRAERVQNRTLGVNPVSPAFDDNGYTMPRGPGMVQPNAFDKLQAFFTRGG